MRNWLWGFLSIIAVIAAAFTLSPWPSIFVVRIVFDRGAAEASDKLEKLVPSSSSTSSHRYASDIDGAFLDIHRPDNRIADQPTIVWIHGGGFVSGRRADITNYAKILAGQGFTVVNLDYQIAPEAHYPEPVRQVNAALAYLSQRGRELGVNTRRMVLAGDSAGAQIAAQTAAVITNPEYARVVGVRPGVSPGQIAGALLYCGVYDISGMGKDGGVLGWFVQSAGWAYSGERDWRTDRQFATMSVAPHLTSTFPPAFVSAGNADPLGPQSVELVAALRRADVPVTTLFFPGDYKPALGHEYQFDLETEAGRLALQQSVAWLKELSSKRP